MYINHLFNINLLFLPKMPRISYILSYNELKTNIL